VLDKVRAQRRGKSGRARQLACAAAAAAALAMVIAGCGSSKSPSASSTTGASFSSYLSCLRSHGVNVPTSRPSGAPSPGSFGAGFAGSGASSSTYQKARQACASLRPSFGGFGGGFATAFKSFRSCMADHGVTIPTTRPAEPPQEDNTNPADRFLNGLNPDNAKVAAALKACESKLPSFAQT